MSGSASVWPHSMHAGEERANAVSKVQGQLSLRAVPRGLLCACSAGCGAGLEAVQGKGALRAHQSQQAAKAQAGHPWPRSRGVLTAVAGESQPSPAYPLSHRQSPSTPLPGSGELRAGILGSHLAP